MAGSGTDAERIATLARENDLLSELLPKGLSVAEIQVLLMPAAESIRAAASDGQATGVEVSIGAGSELTVGTEHTQERPRTRARGRSASTHDVA